MCDDNDGAESDSEAVRAHIHAMVESPPTAPQWCIPGTSQRMQLDWESDS